LSCLPCLIISGQVYHTLLQAREERGIKDIAISRIEQISPFPYDLVCLSS
jgi:2-oxoglutarate dehydrogenase E1 component